MIGFQPLVPAIGVETELRGRIHPEYGNTISSTEYRLAGRFLDRLDISLTDVSELGP